MLYYDIDHKVGAVGVLYPRVVKRHWFCRWRQRHKPGLTKQMFGADFRIFGPLLVNSQRTHRSFVLSDWAGQYLSCFIKCVGAKCTKRCCRVQQRWSARRSVSTQRSPLCALSNSALCTLYMMPTVNLSIPSACRSLEIFERGTVRQKCFYRIRCVIAVWRF